MNSILSPEVSLSALERFEACEGAIELWEVFSDIVLPLAPQSAMFIHGVRFEDPDSACLDAQNNCELLMGSLVSDQFVAEIMGDEELRHIDYYSQYWRRSVLPLQYTCTADRFEPPEVAPLNRLMEDHGVSGGIIVPLRSGGGQSFGTVSLTFDKNSAAKDHVSVPRLVAICHYLNAYLEPAMSRPPECACLSPRERDCLSLVAAGFSTKAISDRRKFRIIRSTNTSPMPGANWTLALVLQRPRRP